MDQILHSGNTALSRNAPSPLIRKHRHKGEAAAEDAAGAAAASVDPAAEGDPGVHAEERRHRKEKKSRRHHRDDSKSL